MRKRFAIASAILLCIIGAIGWFTNTVSISAEAALEEVSRVAEIQIRAQRAMVLSLEALAAETEQTGSVAALALEDSAAFFRAAEENAYEPQGVITREIYRMEATVAREEAVESIAGRLRLLAIKTAELARAKTELDRKFTVSAIRAQVRSDLFVDLQHLLDWHRAVIAKTILIVELLQVLMVPVVAITLYSVWRFLILPSRQGEDQALERLRESEAWALDLAKSASAANDAKSEFLAVMSHELRTPMNGVLGIADALDDEIKDPGQKELLRVLRDSGETLMRILNDLLDVTRLDAGKVQFEGAPFQPNDIANLVERSNRPIAEGKGLDFSIDTSGLRDVTLIGDVHRVTQIVTNILSNAIKFTHSGSVLLTLRIEPDGHLAIIVADTGIGMSDEEVGRIFDWFTQADSSTARRFGGTGLGMSIVRRLVDAMSGKIDVQSTPGEGTRIQILLPLPHADGSQSFRREAEDTFKLPPGFRVLIVDDIETNLMVIDLIMKTFGATTTLASSGRAAIDACAAGTYDLVLMDISMPDIDGVEALAQIQAQRERAGLSPLTVIAVTANAMEHQVVSYLEAGFDGYLAKPVNNRLLGKLLREVAGSDADSEDEAA